MEASNFLLTGLVMTICAFIFQLVGLASPNWITLDIEGNELRVGLWKMCVKLPRENWCLEEKGVRDWLEPVRATSTIGFISLLFALIFIFLKMFVIKDKKNILFVAIGSAFVGGFFILISIADFARKMEDEPEPDGTPLDYHFAFAFAFCIIAMLSAIGAGVAMIADAVKAG